MITSRHTKASSGKVVSMFKPKQRRAMLTMTLSGEKLLRTFLVVREEKVKKPERASVRQAMREMKVL
jgi:hypothetical protein